MKSAPREIWLAIAQYVPEDVLFASRDLDRALYDVATAIEFRCFSIARWDDKTEKKLKEISTSHVRGLVDEIRINTGVVCSPKEPVMLPTSRKRGSVLTLDRGGHRRRRKSQEIISQERCQQFVSALGDALATLPNVTKLQLEWDEEHFSVEQNTTAVCILTKVLPDRNLRNRLQSLSLKLPPDKLGRLASVSLPQLEDFKCHFITAEMPMKEICESLDGFVIFINNLLWSLRSLSFTSTVSSYYFDLTPFVSRLGYFRHLSAFALSIPFDGCHLSDPSKLGDFLQRHSATLLKISLRAERIAEPRTPLGADSKVWIQRAGERIGAEGTWNLRSLELALRPLKADLGLLAQCFARLGPQLDSLTLMDRSLTCSEVQMLLIALSSQAGSSLVPLKKLVIRITRLTPELLDMLANRLPGLRVLDLTFSEIRESEQAEHPCQQTQLDRFLAKMATRKYPTWQLSEIGLNESPFRVLWLDKLEAKLVECIPNLSVRQIPLSLTD